METLTPWHIRMLKFFEAPMRLAAAAGARTDYSFAGSLTQPLEEVFPDFRAAEIYTTRSLAICIFADS